jgi:hypothetical protein
LIVSVTLVARCCPIIAGVRELPDPDQYEREGKSVEQWREDYGHVIIEEVRSEGKTAAQWVEQLHDARRRQREISDRMGARRREVAPDAVIWGNGDDPVYDALRREFSAEYSREVMSNWGLISCGPEAVPYALVLLKDRDSAIREHGAGVLQGLGREASVVDEILAALEAEEDLQVIDTLVAALGEMRSRAALPVLARMLRDPRTDGDTRWQLADALGRIVRRRFDKKDDPVGAAVEWLDAHEVE